MVRALLAALFILSSAGRADLTPTAASTAVAPGPALAPALSPTAAVELKAFEPEPNHPVEDFFTVTLISLPFTAIWSFVGATTVAAIAQSQFPPEYSDSLLVGTAAAAAGLSVGIGLVSVSWGKGKAPAAQSNPLKENP